MLLRLQLLPQEAVLISQLLLDVVSVDADRDDVLAILEAQVLQLLPQTTNKLSDLYA